MQYVLLFLILIPLIKFIYSFEFILNILNLELNQIYVTKLSIYLPTTHRQEGEGEREWGERGKKSIDRMVGSIDQKCNFLLSMNSVS